ncbi:MAG: septation protein A [bacterium]|nr:septation protein A [bacterium]
MKLLFDFLPIIAFFVAFKFAGIYVATGVAIAVSAIQVLWYLARKKKVPTTLWVNLGLITLLGGATIFFHNEWFIKWKPTVLYLFFAGALYVSQKFFGKNLMRSLSGGSVELKDEIWKFLNNSWIIFFIIVGLLNILVAYNVSTSTWVNFKLFGLLGLTFIFAIGQGIYLSRHTEETKL